MTLPDGARQLRQYSLVGAPGSTDLTFAVKPVDAVTDQPAGEVSSWIRANLCVGDLLDVTLPFGDLYNGGRPDGPLVLVSAGIGITPMVGILEFLAAEAPETQRAGPARRPQRQRSPTAGASARADRRHCSTRASTSGTRTASPVAPPACTPACSSSTASNCPPTPRYYLCGGAGFVEAVRTQLSGRGVASERVHCELFAPNDWLLD